MSEPATSSAMGQRWSAKAGAWFGLGASPGALLLGAGIAERHGGHAPLVVILAGVTLMAAMLWTQGLLGLQPPHGENGTLTQIAPRYFGPWTRQALSIVLALAMIGWFGFNVGLGGAGLSALFNLPQLAGPFLLGLPILALSFGGLTRWNRIAAFTTLMALLLVGLVLLRLAPRAIPWTLSLSQPQAMLADLASFIGFVAVFSVRAPDFSVGLATRKDLAWCVGLLCVPVGLVALAGVGLQQGTGSTDLVGILAQDSGLALGNLVVAAAVIAPTFTTLYSGSLALTAATGITTRSALLGVAGFGLVLAATRFDRQLLPWLAGLAAILPPLIVPMAVEAHRRRFGAQPRLIPLWTWAPASLVAIGFTLAQQSYAPLLGLGLAVLLTIGWNDDRSASYTTNS